MEPSYSDYLDSIADTRRPYDDEEDEEESE